MKKTIPFKKDINFKTNLSEITSISLEHTLQISSDNLVSGEFIISGSYKMVESSVNVENFSFNLPFEVIIDEKYIIDNIVVDIDDFYYEIINNNILSINIVVLIDKLEEKPLIIESDYIDENEEIEEEVESVIEEKPLDTVETQTSNKKQATEDIVEDREVVSLFDKFDDGSEAYTTYKVYVVKEGDTVDLIIQNYGVCQEELEKYNNLTQMNIGDKIIIPFVKDEGN